MLFLAHAHAPLSIRWIRLAISIMLLDSCVSSAVPFCVSLTIMACYQMKIVCLYV